jgi:hypothetical protein
VIYYYTKENSEKKILYGKLRHKKKEEKKIDKAVKELKVFIDIEDQELLLKNLVYFTLF